MPGVYQFYLNRKTVYDPLLPGSGKYLWDDQSLAALGLDKNKCPPLIAPGTIAGRVTAKASRELGIPANIPVVACGTDFLMSILGTAAVCPGRLCDRAGTSEGLNLCTEKPIDDARLTIMPHIIRGCYNASGILPAAGKTVEWIKNNTGYADLDYNSLLTLASGKPEEDNPIFLPFFLKSRSTREQELQKMQTAFLGLKLEHTSRHLVQAVLASTGYAMLDILKIMEEHTTPVEAIRVSGSLASIPSWNQLRADLTGKKILKPLITDSELTGAACLGYLVLGVYKDLPDAAEKLVRIEQIFEPDKEQTEVYRLLYSRYRDACTGMGLWNR